ncbi:MAG: S-adenosylmethionine hydrolase [Cryomorphaceae bacterium]|jgi:S-adenosylmethionine hydrolase
MEEAIISKETLKGIEELRAFVNKNGIVKSDVVDKLLALRPHFIEHNLPLVTRVVRMTAEYIDHYGYFNLNLLAEEAEVEEVEEGEEEAAVVEVQEEIDMEGEDSFTEVKENFLYLLDLFAHPDNQVNKDELTRVKQLYLDRDLF